MMSDMYDEIIERMREVAEEGYPADASCQALHYVFLGGEYPDCNDLNWDQCRECSEKISNAIDELNKQLKSKETKKKYVDKDGKKIRIGDKLYGHDGIAWIVRGFDDKNKFYPIIGYSLEKGERGLKPEWLGRNKPDQWEIVLHELEKKNVSTDSLNYIRALIKNSPF